MFGVNLLCVVLSVSLLMNIMMQIKLLKLIKPLWPIAEGGVKTMAQFYDKELKSFFPAPVKVKRKYTRRKGVSK